MLGISSPLSTDTDALIQDFRRQGELAEADFSQRFEEAQNLPLGPSPALATEIQITLDGECTVLDFALTTKQRMNVVLPPKLVHGLTKMLLDVQCKGGWGLEPMNAMAGAGSTVRH